MTGDTQREATRGDVSALKQENEQLKLVVAELVLRNRVLKKAGAGGGEPMGQLKRASASEKRELIRLVGRIVAVREANAG